jgi:hypothetical protein
MSTARHIRSFWNGHYWEVQTKREGESEFNYHSPTIASVWPIAPNFMDAEATANIFAAAPDLLEALKDTFALACAFAGQYAHSHDTERGSFHPIHEEIIAKAQAAIAKAEGEGK